MVTNILQEWKKIKLKDIITIMHGRDQKKIVDENGLYPILGSGGEIGRTNSYLYNRPSVLIGRKGTINHPMYLETPFWTIDTLYYSEISEDVYPKFVFYLFCIIDWLSINESSGRPSLTSHNIENIELKIPSSIEEQKKIANELFDVDKLINNLGKLIEKKKNIKQGAMQELLTGKRRLEGFSEEWETNTLDGLGYFSKGKGIKKDEILDSGTPCIRYGEIYTKYNTYVIKPISYISKDVAKSSYKIKEGDILFSGSGEDEFDIGKCVVYLGKEECYAGGDIIIFTPFNDDPLFLSYLLNSRNIKKQMTNMAQGDMVVHIYSSHLKRIFFQIPSSIEEQIGITKILSDMDEEIKELEKQLHKYIKLKQGMMQKLLTGEIRLV